MRNLLILSLIGLVVAAGCVQPASTEIAPTQVGLNATFTAVPPTAVPTDPPTETPFEAQADTNPGETATPSIPPTETATATATFTPSITPSATPTSADSAFLPDSQDGAPPLGETGDGQQQPPDPAANPFEQTATAIVAGATQTEAFIQTATAIGAGIGLPTFTPTADPNLGQPVQPVITLTPQPQQPILPGTDCVHEVRPQDQNLYRLSLAYGVRVADIVARNPEITNQNLIYLGQRIIIPGCGTTGGRPPATSTPVPGGGVGNPGTGGPGGSVPPTGDCTWGTSVIFPNGCPGGNVGTGGSTGSGNVGTGGPGVGTRQHVVEQGETLFEIALLYGVTVAQIQQLNGIPNANNITMGDVLAIP